MFLILCRTNNQRPKDENIIDSHLTLDQAKAALRKECKSKKEYLVFESEQVAMFSSKLESWVIEICSEKEYYRNDKS